MTERLGGCLCGAVRYRLTSEPLAVAVCHCTHCQKQSGAMFSTNLVVPEVAFDQTGATKVFKDQGDSGLSVDRHFCPDCGSPILSRAGIMPGMVLLKAGTLDEMCDRIPVVEVYTDHAAPWVAPVVGAQRFAQGSG